MATKFVQQVSQPSKSAFCIGNRFFEYKTYSPEQTEALCASADEWTIRCEEHTTVDHDEYGDYSYDPKAKYVDLLAIKSLSERVSIFDISGDIIIEDGEIVGVLLNTGEDNDRLGNGGFVPLDEYHCCTDSDNFQPDSGETSGHFSIFYTNGELEGFHFKRCTLWESRAIYYYTTIFYLEKKTTDQTIG